MVTTLNDAKRANIASKLASMKAIQELLIKNDRQLASDIPDQKIQERLHEMYDDDRKNLGILETVIVQYGIPAEPAETVVGLVNTVKELMTGSKLSPYEKLSQHELLKHNQTMTGLLIHKAAQIVGADVEAAITPLNTVNFENRAHQEQLKGMLELLGVRELTGQEADQGLWARVQDAVAALSGVAGSVLTQNSDQSDVDIQSLIRADHTKVSVLFSEIENSRDPAKIQEYFGQLYKDLTVHAEAEEQVVYPQVHSVYGESETEGRYSEQAEMKRELDQIKAMDPSSSDFKTAVKLLKETVLAHVREEENTMLPTIGRSFSAQQREQMATDFKAAKQQLQLRLAQSR
ncbi:hemerythrin domain-containing protein [Phormidium tenue FACHB-886]|nr:hemerythrin domain-containing protein [Phormidium tenue FACHB-886]